MKSDEFMDRLLTTRSQISSILNPNTDMLPSVFLTRLTSVLSTVDGDGELLNLVQLRPVSSYPYNPLESNVNLITADTVQVTEDPQIEISDCESVRSSSTLANSLDLDSEAPISNVLERFPPSSNQDIQLEPLDANRRISNSNSLTTIVELDKNEGPESKLNVLSVVYETAATSISQDVIEPLTVDRRSSQSTISLPKKKSDKFAVDSLFDSIHKVSSLTIGSSNEAEPKTSNRALQLVASENIHQDIALSSTHNMTNRIVDTQCTKKIERPALKSLKNSPLPNSILSPEDHIFYLDCLKSNQLSSTEMKRFHQLQTLVAKEKEVYRIYQQAITTMDKEKLERCSEPAERFFLEKIQERKSRVFFNYSSNIKHLKSLFFATEYNDNPALTFGQTIAKTGNLLKLNLLPIKTDLKLRSTTERKSIMPVISEDMKIPPMLKDKDIDVCISSSTLETLISSFGTNSDAYEIPVKIVENLNGLGTTVLIDKSLPLPKLNNREKMTQYLKMATLNQLMDGVSQNNPTIWYNHWTFGNLKLLIRTNLLGIQKTNRVATVKCKLEYQIEKGYEVLDDSTRINWWASHYIRPNAELWVANLNPINESIIRFDKIPSIDIIPNREWPIPFINALYSILTEVKSLPVGQYYLSKDYGARSVDILKSVQTKTERPFPLCSLVNYPRHVYTWPMVEWKGPPSQIPFTFPPSSEGQRKSKLAIPLWFCKIFKLKNRCNRQLCPYSHLTKRDLRILFDQDDSRFIPSSEMNERESNKCNMKRRKQPEDRSKRTKLESVGWKDADAASNSLNDVLQYD